MTLHAAPPTLADLRQFALGAQLYAVAGTDHTGRPAVYLGESGRLDEPRAAISYTKWARELRAITPRALVLITHPEPATWALRRCIEAETLRALTQTAIVMNTQTGCTTARNMLTRPERLLALDTARALAAALHDHTLGASIEPPIAGRDNNREALIRLLNRETRALNTNEVHQRATAAGVPVTGRTPLFTLRRDLAIRERVDGVPRIRTCLVHGTRVYYNARLTKRFAINGYLNRRRLPQQ